MPQQLNLQYGYQEDQSFPCCILLYNYHLHLSQLHIRLLSIFFLFLFFFLFSNFQDKGKKVNKSIKSIKRNNFKVLGTQVQTLITSEDRHLFNEALAQIGIPYAKSTAVSTVEEAVQSANQIGYPVIVRSAFALGGLGSGFANNDEEMRQLATKSLSLSPQILVEKSMKG